MQMLIASEKGNEAFSRVTRCLNAVRESQSNSQVSDADLSTLIGMEAELGTLESTLARLGADDEIGLSQFDSVLADVHAYCESVEEGLAVLKGDVHEHA